MSLLANVAGEMVRATPGALAACPHCAEPMRAKCGRIIVWHWAHVAGVACDAWSEGETRWHLESKLALAELGCRIEQRVTVDGRWHIADAITPGGVVIELQHSSIGVVDIEARERHYERMVWVFHAERWLSRLHFGGRGGFWWKHGAQSQAFCTTPVLWDCRPLTDLRPSRGRPMAGLSWVDLDVIERTNEWGEVSRRVLGRVIAHYPDLASVIEVADNPSHRLVALFNAR